MVGNNVSHANNKTKRRFEINLLEKKFYLPEQEKSVTLKAVSYTHLDVYKRQIYEYALSEGNLEYRQALQDYYHRLGFTDLTTKDFIVTNGGSEALNFAISTLCDDSDEVIIP